MENMVREIYSGDRKSLNSVGDRQSFLFIYKKIDSYTYQIHHPALCMNDELK